MATNDALGTPAARGRGIDITLWVLQVLLAVFFIVASAAPKLLGEQTAVEVFTEIGAGQWLRYLVGVLELAGGIGLLIPRTAGLAALGLAGVMVGAVITQLFILDAPLIALTPAILFVLLVVIAWRRLSHSGR
jgi:putative oxidoreductase